MRPVMRSYGWVTDRSSCMALTAITAPLGTVRRLSPVSLFTISVFSVVTAA